MFVVWTGVGLVLLSLGVASTFEGVSGLGVCGGSSGSQVWGLVGVQGL